MMNNLEDKVKKAFKLFNEKKFEESKIIFLNLIKNPKFDKKIYFMLYEIYSWVNSVHVSVSEMRPSPSLSCNPRRRSGKVKQIGASREVKHLTAVLATATSTSETASECHSST